MVDLMDTCMRDRNPIQAHHANDEGTTHGGYVLHWMDEVVSVSALCFAGEHCAPAHVDSVDFERPLQGGDSALFEADVYDAGPTSARLRVRA